MILTLDGKTVDRFSDIIPFILLEDVAVVEVQREGKRERIVLPPQIKKDIIQGARLFSPRYPFVVGGYSENSIGQKAGLQLGDRIVAVDSLATPMADQLRPALAQFKNSEVTVMVNRQGQNIPITVQLYNSAMLGVSIDLENVLQFETKHYSFIEAIPAGVTKAYDTGKKYLQQFKLIFSSETQAYKEVGGFITIGKIFPGVWNWQSFWSLTAFLSIMLAILNLLPIPALDGGHVMFLLYEMITGKQPGEKFMEYAQMTGMLILFALLIFANGNDIIKLFQ